MTPAFSADGAFIAFSDYDLDSARGVAMMAFDGATRKASAYKKIYQTASPNYIAWPFILPDDKGIVCAIGPNGDFSGAGVGLQPAAAGRGSVAEGLLAPALPLAQHLQPQGGADAAGVVGQGL